MARDTEGGYLPLAIVLGGVIAAAIDNPGYFLGLTLTMAWTVFVFVTMVRISRSDDPRI